MKIFGKRSLIIICFLIVLGTTTAWASMGSENAEHRCRQYSQKRFLAVVNVYKGEALSRAKIEIDRSMRPGVDQTPFVLDESAIIISRNNKEDRMYKRSRALAVGDDCSIESAIGTESFTEFGIPLIPPPSLVDVGSSWIKRLKIVHEQREIPITISYKMEEVKKIMGKYVAVVGLILSGVDLGSSDEQRKRWAGVGLELWDVKDGSPIMRNIEMRYGRSFATGEEIKIEYSEARKY